MKGFSLIELLLVVATVGMIVLLIVNIPSSILLINKSKHQSLAREIAAKTIEDTRATTYENLANGTVDIIDSRLSQLPLGFGTKNIEDCSLQICTNGEESKELTVTVNWKESGKDISFTAETLVSAGGLGQ